MIKIELVEQVKLFKQIIESFTSLHRVKNATTDPSSQ